MSSRNESLHRFLRPAQPIAVGFMLAQICTGTLVIALGVLLGPRLDAFTLALIVTSGAALAALGVRDAERDRTILPRDNWPSFRARAIVWGSVILFAGSPLVFVALVVDRFAGTSIVAATAIGVSSMGWGVTSYRKLRFNQVWLPRPKDEEVEAGLAIGALLLSATLLAGWMLVEIDGAFGYGPLPSALRADGAILLSIFVTALAGGVSLVPMLVKRVTNTRSRAILQVAFGVMLVPLGLLLVLPMSRWGHPLPSFVPVYAAEMAGRVFLAVVFAFSVVEFVRCNKAANE